MKKRKRIQKQLEKIYLKNRKQFSKTDRFLFKLLIAKQVKTGEIILIIFAVKLLK